MSQNVPLSVPPADEQCEQTFDSDRPDGFSERQRLAIEMIASGVSDTDVAKEIGVSRRTIYRWRIENARFREELQLRRREMYDRTQDRFRSMLTRALDLLDKQISDKYAPTALRAARTLLYVAQIGKTSVPQDQSSEEKRKMEPQINADERR
jgi:DNA-binding XRE family transcriptional regulator